MSDDTPSSPESRGGMTPDREALDWTPADSDETGNVWMWEGRAFATRIFADPATHAYIVGLQRDYESLLAERDLYREALRGLVSADRELRDAQSERYCTLRWATWKDAGDALALTTSATRIAAAHDAVLDGFSAARAALSAHQEGNRG